jgi:hypothetical protein
MVKTLRKNFDRNELRRDRRYPLPPVTVMLGHAAFTTVNWSLGGFLIEGGPDLAVGTRVEGELRTEGATRTQKFTAEVLRRDRDGHATGFCFIERSDALVDALDRSIAGRMAGRRATLPHVPLLALLVFALGLALGAPARADGTDATAAPASSALVRGGAAMPQFTGNFPMDFGSPVMAPSSSGANLQSTIESSSDSVLHFLLTPQTLSGQSFGFNPAASNSYAGVGWNVFQANRLYGSIMFSGAANGIAGDDPTRRLYGPLLSLHSTLELGYDVGAQQNLSLAFDKAAPAPYAGDRSAYGEYLRFQYGYHF